MNVIRSAWTKSAGMSLRPYTMYTSTEVTSVYHFLVLSATAVCDVLRSGSVVWYSEGGVRVFR